jgi:hypothetical protein
MLDAPQYPPKATVDAMIAEAGNVARVAIALDLTWWEVDEIHRYGQVSERTAAFWNCCRRESARVR